MSRRSWAALVSASVLVATAGGLVPASTGAASVAPAAGAGDTWGAVHRFERNPHGQSLVVDAHGATTVAWGSQRGWPEPVKVARRTPGGRWLAPVTLGTGFDPVVAADAAGNLTVVWCRDRKGFTTGVWAARKPVGHPWTRPVRLSRDRKAPGYPDGDTSYGARSLDVAVAPGGAALVTWAWGGPERGVPLRIQAVHRPPQGTWGAVSSVTPAVGASAPHAILGRNGSAWVAYERSPASGPAVVEVRSRPATGGAWTAAHRVGSGSLGDLGIDRLDDVSVFFRHAGRVRVAVHTATTGAWEAPVPVTPAAVRIRAWSVAMNRAGTGLVAYLSGRDRVDVVRRAHDGRFIPPTRLATPGVRLSGVVAAVGQRGDLYAGWDNGYGMWGRAHPAGQAWHRTTTVQPDTGQVDVLEAVLAQVAPGGDVALLWEQEERPLRMRVLDVS